MIQLIRRTRALVCAYRGVDDVVALQAFQILHSPQNFLQLHHYGHFHPYYDDYVYVRYARRFAQYYVMNDFPPYRNEIHLYFSHYPYVHCVDGANYGALDYENYYDCGYLPVFVFPLVLPQIMI